MNSKKWYDTGLYNDQVNIVTKTIVMYQKARPACKTKSYCLLEGKVDMETEVLLFTRRFGQYGNERSTQELLEAVVDERVVRVVHRQHLCNAPTLNL